MKAMSCVGNLRKKSSMWPLSAELLVFHDWSSFGGFGLGWRRHLVLRNLCWHFFTDSSSAARFAPEALTRLFREIPVYFWGASGPPSSSTVFSSTWHSWEVQSRWCLCSLRCWALIRAAAGSTPRVQMEMCLITRGVVCARGRVSTGVGGSGGMWEKPRLRLLFLKGSWSENRKWRCPIRCSRYHVSISLFSVSFLSCLVCWSLVVVVLCLPGSFASVWSFESLCLCL